MKRQGDLLFERIDESTNQKMRGVKEDRVIEHGETTGHSHKLEGGTLRYGDRSLLIDAPEGAAVTHEEHDRVELEPGVWLVHRQQEYVGEGEKMAQVYD